MTSFRIFLFACLGLLGCGPQELPTTRLDEPDFFLDGSLDGAALSLQAGEAGYFMGTSYALVRPAVYRFAGHLSPAGCINCPEGLSLYLRDLRRRPSAPTLSEQQLDSALRPGTYAFFQEGTPPQENVTRVAFQNDDTTGQAAQYRWSFGDGNTHTGPNPIHDYTNPEAEVYLVCLEGQDSLGCQTTICNEVFLADSTCQLDFEHQLQPSSNYVVFRARMEGTPPFSYRWDFGDGFGSSLANPGYTYAQPGRYTVCLTVTDGTGCQQSLCKNIAADPAFCEHNFSYNVTRTTITDTSQLSRITLVWTDAGGKRYSSAQGPQPSGSFFTLLDQAPYVPNEAGQGVRRLRLRSEARLYAEDGSHLDLRITDASLGVAHP